MPVRFAALVLAAVTLNVHAQEAPDSEWQANPVTLATLLQDGYRIVSVIEAPRADAGSLAAFYLQRDQNAFKCLEQRQPEPQTKTPGTHFSCFELVQPHAATKGK